MKHVLFLSAVLSITALLVYLDRLDATITQQGREILQLQQHAIGIELRMQKAEQAADEAVETARAVKDIVRSY